MQHSFAFISLLLILIGQLATGHRLEERAFTGNTGEADELESFGKRRPYPGFSSSSSSSVSASSGSIDSSYASYSSYEHGTVFGIYIEYNGTITGDLVVNAHPECNNTLQVAQKVSAKVGVHGTWDPNDWFFGVYHGNSEGCEAILCTTNDEIVDLYFWSAIFYEYAGFYNLDLSKARVALGQVANETGYTVHMDQTAWYQKKRGGNDPFAGVTVLNCNVSYVQDGGTVPDYCSNYLGCTGFGLAYGRQFRWNNTNPFTIDLSFSNSSFTAAFALSTPRYNLTLNLDLERSETQPKWDTDGSTAVHTLVELDTSSATVPMFRYISNDTIVHLPYPKPKAPAKKPKPTPMPKQKKKPNASSKPSSITATSLLGVFAFALLGTGFL